MKALATLLAVLACLVLPVAAVSAWVHEQILDTDHYVSALTPLGQKPVVRNAAAGVLDAAILDASNLTGSDTARSAVDTGVREVLGTDAFATVWADGNRAAHEEVIAALADGRDGRDSPVADDGTIGIDLADLAQPVVDRIGSSLGTTVTVPDDALSQVGVSLDLVNARDLARARSGYALVDTLALWPVLAWAVLAGVALLIPGARRRVLAVLGVGSLAVAGLLAAAILVGRRELVSRAGSGNGRLVGAVWDTLVHSLWTGLAIGSVVAVLALVLSGVLGVTSRRRPTAV